MNPEILVKGMDADDSVGTPGDEDSGYHPGACPGIPWRSAAGDRLVKTQTASCRLPSSRRPSSGLGLVSLRF